MKALAASSSLPPRRPARRAKGLVVALLGAGALLGACSRKPAPREGSQPLVVLVSGCAAMRADATCERPASGLLRLLVLDATDVRVSIGGARQEIGEPAIVEGGVRVGVSVPPGTMALTVVARIGARDAAAIVTIAEDATPEWAREAQRAKVRGEGANLERILAAHEGDSAPSGAFVHALRGRMALGRADFPGAVVELERSRRAHAAAGRTSAAVDDALAETYVLAEQVHDYARARTVLEEARPLTKVSPDSAAALPYYEAILARVSGDVRGALTAAREAETRAYRLGLEVEEREAQAERARAWEESGRFAAACGLLTSLAAKTLPSEGPCTGPRRRANLGVVTLDARETLGKAPPECPADPVALLERAVADFAACPAASEVANAHLALARAYADEGNAARAGQELHGLPGAPLTPAHQVRASILEGRLAFERTEYDRALTAFEDAGRRANAIGLTIHALRATLGSASVLAARGDAKGALRTITEALVAFDRSALALPMTDGRAAFFGTIEAATRARFDLLASLGEDRRAFDEVLRSRARAAWSAEVGQEVGAMAADARRRWDDAVGGYHRARLDLERQAQANVDLPVAEATAQRRSLEDAEERLRRALGAALDSAGSAGPARASEGACVPPPGTTWLALGRAEHGVVALVLRSDGHVHRRSFEHLPEMADPNGALRIGLTPDLIEHTEVLHVVADPVLAPVDVHALLYQGMPLGVRVAVEYAVRGTCDASAGRGSLARGPLLLVADSKGDLPGARAEASIVAELFERARVPSTTLLQQRATGAAVREAVPSARLLHYAGHARRGAEPWTAALLLHADDHLDVGDVVAFRDVPPIVALSACEGAMETHETTGVAQALIGRGAQVVLASTRPVRDRSLATYWRAFYQSFLDGTEPTRLHATRSARAALAAVAVDVPEDLLDALALRVLVP